MLFLSAHYLEIVAKYSMAEVEDDFLTVTNPVLVHSFEEAERTFSLDSSVLNSSFRTQPDSGNSSGEEVDSDAEEVTLMNRTVDVEEYDIIEFFKKSCCCTLGANKGPCSNALPKEYAVQYHYQCMETSFHTLMQHFESPCPHTL